MQLVAVMFSVVVVLLVGQPAASTGEGTDTQLWQWPQFRGPNRDGTSREDVPLPAGGLKKVWATTLANDFSCLSIQDGRIYTMATKDRNATTTVYCLDANTGKVLWEAPVSGLVDETGAASTPTVSGTRVIAVGADGRIVCLNKDDGKLLWDVQMNLKPAQYTYSSSPLVHKDKVIVLGGPTIRAFDLATGKECWKTDWQIPPGGGRWSSPVLGVLEGKETVVCLSRSNLVGLDPEDGSPRWKFALEAKPMGEDLPNTPVIVGNRIAFIAFRAEAARKTRILCVEIKDGVATECWRSADKIGNRTQSLVAWNDHLYLTAAFNAASNPDATANEKTGTINCFDLQSGERLWSSSAPQTKVLSEAGRKVSNDNDGGAFMTAMGKLLLLNSSGSLTVSDISEKGCTILQSFDVLGDLKAAKPWGDWQFLVPPLLLNGRLYLRNSEKVICYDLR